jgi:hypothetical protein
VGELVDEGDLGVTLEESVEIHLLKECSPVFDNLARDHIEIRHQLLGMKPPVALHEPNDDISTPLAPPVTLVQHGIGLPNSRRGTQVYSEVASRFDLVGIILEQGGLGVH